MRDHYEGTALDITQTWEQARSTVLTVLRL